MKKGLTLVVVMLLSGCAVLAGPAQDVLGDLADSARIERIVSGWTTVGTGVVIGVGGYLLGNELKLGSYALIAGGVVALPGVVTLMVPSEAELACRRSCDSETESSLALERLAGNAKLERILSGVVNIAAGVASLLFPYSYVTQYDYIYSAVMSFGLAAVDLFFPSKEERAYESYKLLLPSAE